MAREIITLGTVALATTDDTVESFRLSGESLGQTAQRLRASSITLINRGNRSRGFSILVKRVPAASPGACRAAILAHELALQAAEAAGVVNLSWNYQGIGYVLRQVLVRHEAEQRGTTALHTYTGTFAALETASL